MEQPGLKSAPMRDASAVDSGLPQHTPVPAPTVLFLTLIIRLVQISKEKFMNNHAWYLSMGFRTRSRYQVLRSLKSCIKDGRRFAENLCTSAWIL